MCLDVLVYVSPPLPLSDLDKGEGRARAERLRFMFHLILDVLLHALLLVNLLLLLHVEEDSRRHSDSDGILRLRLEDQRLNVYCVIQPGFIVATVLEIHSYLFY